MPRRTIALSSTRRTRITATYTPPRRRRDPTGRRRQAAAPALARRRAGGHPDRDHAAVAGLGLDAQVAARQPRALAHPAQAEGADAGQRLEVVGRLEAVAVVGDGQHHAVAQAAQVDVHAGRVGVALDVGQRLLEDPAQLAQRERRQRADVVERAADARAGALPPARGLGADRGRQRQLGVVAPAQAATAARAPPGPRCARPRRACARPPRRPAGRRDAARERERGEADAVHGLGQRVVHVAREPLALGLRGERALLVGERRSASAWRSSSRRAPAPATATIGYSAGSTTTVRKSVASCRRCAERTWIAYA